VVAQQEIFGPVLAAMTFRTPAEAVELANNTVYGLAACVWSESINVSLQWRRDQAGVVWVNCTNMFDAACGFGGYRESGYGREEDEKACLSISNRYGSSALRRFPQQSANPKPQQRNTGEIQQSTVRKTLHRRKAGKTRFWLQL